MTFTQDHVEHYHKHGFVVVEDFLEPAELAGAREELEQLMPGWLSFAAEPTGERPAGWDEAPRSRRTVRFPFPGVHLNKITTSPELRRFAGLLAGHDELVCEQSDLTYKCTGHYSDAEQPIHLDYMNHTLTYPSSEPRYWQTAFLIYYTDVTADHAPTAVCSWQHYREELHWPAIHERNERPDLYAAEQTVTVRAGAVLAYSMRTYHRGTAFKGVNARVGHFITYAPRNCPWLGIVGWPEQGVHQSFHRWVEQSSLEERALLGFPPPGHDYWTEEMLAGVGARFPKLDLTPYEAALRSVAK